CSSVAACEGHAAGVIADGWLRRAAREILRQLAAQYRVIDQKSRVIVIWPERRAVGIWIDREQPCDDQAIAEPAQIRERYVFSGKIGVVNFGIFERPNREFHRALNPRHIWIFNKKTRHQD